MKVYEQLEIAAHRAYTRGLQTGSGGNLSARSEAGDTMIVKSSGGSFADCDKQGAGFVETDFEGNVVPGAEGKPTREAFLHGLMYQISDKIGGVVHTHSPYSIAWAFGKKDLPQTTLHMGLKMGCDIPVVDIPTATVMAEHGEIIRKLFEENPKLPAFILCQHGIVAVGKDALEAEHNAELVEETAQIALMKGICEKLSLY